MKTKQLLLLLLLLVLSSATFAQSENPFASISKKGKILTLTKGQYNETFDADTIQQIGSSLINVRTMKVVKLLTDDETKKRLEGEKHSRFLSVDPLAAKYPELTPYCFVANNPIRYMDPDGRDIVDPNGKHVRIIYNKNGTLSFSKNATTDIIRIANALNLTEAGRAQLKKIDQSDIKVKLNISTSTKIIKEKDKVSYEYGRTEQGNSNNPPSYSKYINQEGVYGIKEATIMIFEGTIKEGIKESSGLKHEGLNMEQAIGAVAGHEIIHATDKTEINKDIKVEFGSKKEKKVREASREIKPNQIERKIIDQSKKLNE